jgi:hypothetical protein
MPYTLGVDLGASTSAAAIERDGELAPCTLGETTLSVTSIVLPRDDGRTLIGEAAALHGGIAAVRLACQSHQRLLDPTAPVPIGAIDPHRPMCMLLTAVIDQAASGQGGRPLRVVLTQPAADVDAPFGPFRRVAMDADVDSLVATPVAATALLDRGRGMTLGETMAVLDLGGDTTEATLVRRTAGGYEIVGQPRHAQGLGGEAVEAALVRHIDGVLGGAVAALDPGVDSHVVALHRLRAGCRRALEHLLHADETVIEVGFPHRLAGVPLTRDELQQVVRRPMADAAALLDRTVSEASLAPADLHAILLIGGPARLPVASDLVSERLGRSPVVTHQPELSAAYGAALLGSPVTAVHDSAPGSATRPMGATPPGGTVRVEAVEVRRGTVIVPPPQVTGPVPAAAAILPPADDPPAPGRPADDVPADAPADAPPPAAAAPLFATPATPGAGTGPGTGTTVARRRPPPRPEATPPPPDDDGNGLDWGDDELDDRIGRKVVMASLTLALMATAAAGLFAARSDPGTGGDQGGPLALSEGLDQDAGSAPAEGDAAGTGHGEGAGDGEKSGTGGMVPWRGWPPDPQEPATTSTSRPVPTTADAGAPGAWSTTTAPPGLARVGAEAATGGQLLVPSLPAPTTTPSTAATTSTASTASTAPAAPTTTTAAPTTTTSGSEGSEGSEPLRSSTAPPQPAPTQDPELLGQVIDVLG